MCKKLMLMQVEEAGDGTKKYLFQLEDGNMIETALMRHNFGNTVCVTSQVGCNMGCAFCASGQLKKVRDLTCKEMVAQVEAVAEEIAQEGAETEQEEGHTSRYITHIVLMGIGEPLDNLTNVQPFLETMMDQQSYNIAPRKITLSTCGLVPGIKRLADSGLKNKLAISLHGATDEVRNQLMPINRKYPLDELFEAVDYYIDKTNSRVALEYIMIDGLTDTLEQAQSLVNRIGKYRKKIMVNLIPYNAVDGVHFKRSSKENIQAFFEYLIRRKIFTFRREEKGSDVKAACGQLRSRQLQIDKEKSS